MGTVNISFQKTDTLLQVNAVSTLIVFNSHAVPMYFLKLKDDIFYKSTHL